MNLYQAMKSLYDKYGYFSERVSSCTLEGLEGPKKMAAIMEGLRKAPPVAFAGLRVTRIRDYESGQILDKTSGETLPTGLPHSNVLFYDLEEGCSLIVRPSGTEPKIKLYVMARGAAEQEAGERASGLSKEGMKLFS